MAVGQIEWDRTTMDELDETLREHPRSFGNLSKTDREPEA